MRHLFTFLALFLTSSVLLAQTNNLKVSYANTIESPNNITICGAPDTISVVIATDGSVLGARSNIKANLRLFKGIRFVGIIASGTSTGIAVVSGAGTSTPVLTLPNLTPGSTNSVTIRMSVSGSCDAVDSLKLFPDAAVLDEWNFSYDLGGDVALTETDLNAEYRDAIKIPIFGIGLTTGAVSPTVGQPFGRTVKVSNSGLNGYVSAMTYTNLQGPGIWIKQLKVNGVVVPMTKIKQTNGDTLTTVLLSGANFALNTVGANASNGNILFEKDEQLTITEEAILVSCAKSRASTHTAAWGCSATVCDRVSKTDFVYVGDGTVQIGSSTSGLPVTKKNVGYCQEGIYPLRFTNNGIAIDPGTANMMNVAVGLGLGDAFLLQKGPFSITQLSIAGQLFENPDSGLVQLNNLFATDIDGEGGLTDLDNDGFFDDMAPNATIDIIAYVSLDCSLTNVFDAKEFSVNDLDMTLNARIDHTNFCGERVSFARPRVYTATHINDVVENCSDPDVLVGGGQFTVMHFQRRNVFNFEKNCNGEEKYIVSIPMQNGFIPNATASSFFRSTTQFSLLSDEIIADTLYLTYSGAGSTFLNGDYFFNLVVDVNCDAPLGASFFDVKVQYSCPPCDCKHTWYQANIPGPFVHQNPSVCPNNLAVCEESLQTTNFEVNRTTFGYADANYTTPMSPSQADTKIAIVCDSVQMVIRNIVGSTVLTDSLGVAITYINPTGTDSIQQVFLFDQGEVLFKTAAGTQSCTIDTSDISLVILDSLKTVYFSFDKCLAELGLTLQPGDSVIFVGNFSLNPLGPIKDQFTKVPQFRGFGYHIANADTLVCDSYGVNFKLARVRSVFSFPSSSNMPKGCAQTDLNYRILTVNNNFKDFFIGEYRAAVKVDSIKFYFDPLLLESFDKVEITASIPGHPTFGNNFYSVEQLDTSGFYIARFDTLLQVPSYNLIQSYAFNLRVRLVPSCKSLTGSASANNKFNFDPVIYYTDRYFAKEIGDGSCALYARDSINNDIVYTEPPILNISPVTNPNATPLGDTTTWVVKVFNSSTKGDAKATFLSLIDSTNNVQILSVEDITDPANLRVLDVNEYGNTPGYYYCITDGFKIATSSSSLNDVTNTLRIKAKVNACQNNEFKIVSGYSCTTFDTLNWTPEAYAPCQEVTFGLAVNTSGANLEASFINTEAFDLRICDTVEFEMVVRNTDLGPALVVNANITLPLIGALLLPGLEVAWPSNGVYQQYNEQVTLGETSIQGQQFLLQDILSNIPFLTQFGLPGFNPLVPSDSNEIRIRFRIATDCDYISGKVIYHRFGGESACGDALGGNQGNSQPLYVEGTVLPNLVFETELLPGSVLTSSGNGKVNFSITNTGDETTTGNDYFIITVPDSVSYFPNSASGSGSWFPGEPITTQLGNFTQYEWNLPEGLSPGEAAQLGFSLGAIGLDCGDEPVGITYATIRKVGVLCEATQNNCEIDVLTSTGGEQLAILPISESPLALLNSTGTSICSDLGTETINFIWELQASQNLAAASYVLQLFNDANNNDSLDLSETVLYTLINGPAYTANQIQTLPFTVSALANQLCNLRLNTQLSDTNCPIPTQAVAPPRLLNAGADNSFCANASTSDLSLGVSNCSTSYTYNWQALAPAQVNWLSNPNITNPNLTFPTSGSNFGDYFFVLATTRSGECAVSLDTVKVSRLAAPSIATMSDVFLLPGSSTTLMANISGNAPFIYTWSPATGLDNTSLATPKVQILTTTTYTVNVLDANGCSDSDTVTVVVDADLNATAIPAVSEICEGQTQMFIAGGGNLFTWFETSGNTPTGLLSSYNVQNPIFSGGLPGQTYTYFVIVGDTNLPGITDTASVSITVKPGLDVLVTAPEAGSCGDSLTLTASGAFMYLWFELEPFTIIQAGIQSTYTTNQSESLMIIGTKIGYCRDTVYYQIEPGVDNEAPVFGNIPENLTLTCGDQIPVSATPTVTDNCDTDVNVVYSELPYTASDCNYTLTRQWVATDASGNSALLTQTITFIDDTAPFITFTNPLLIGLQDGDTLFFDCVNPPIFSADDAVAVDACDGSPNVTFSDIWVNVGSCQENGYTILMYCGWTAVDACGNSSKLTFFVQINDDTAPVFTTVPEDLILEIGQTIPAVNLNQATATDDCGTPTISVSETSEIINCYLTIFREWVATDVCGNTATHLQTLIVEGDTTPPVITVLHPMLQGVNNLDTIFADCSMELVAMGLGDVSVSVDCNDFPTVVFKETFVDTIPCEIGGFLRLLRCTWEATDGFGNMSSFRFFVKVIDTTNPILQNVPSNLFLSNISQLLPPDPLVATDDCDENVDIVFIQDSVGVPGCATEIKRTWIATDHCGNVDMAEQFIYILNGADQLTWNGLQNGDTLSVNCGSALPVVGNTDIDWDATCLNNPNLTLQTDTLSAIGCDGNGFLLLLKHTWTATTVEGEIFNFVAFVAVSDNTPPVFTQTPEHLFVASLSTLTPAPFMSATDNCDSEVEISFYEISDTLSCGNSIYRSWVATDNCGNISVASQEISLLCDCALGLFGEGSTLRIQIDCNIPQTYCAAIPPANLDNYTFYDNGELYTGSTSTCESMELTTYDMDQLPGDGEEEIYLLTDFAINNQLFSGIFENVEGFLVQLNEWDTIGDWQIWPGTNTISADATNGNTYGAMQISVVNQTATNTILPFPMTMPTGTVFEFGTGTHYFEAIENATGCRDTTYIKVVCVELPTLQVQTYVTLGSFDVYCLGQLGLGNIVSVDEICPNLSGDNVLYEYDPETQCYYYDGLSLGTDSLCLSVCLDNNLCALVYIQTSVVPSTGGSSQNLVATVGQLGQICLNPDELTGTVSSITCIEDPNVALITFSMGGTLCLPYYAISPGQTAATFVVCDNQGHCDTVVVNITIQALAAALLPNAINDFTGTKANTDVRINVLENDAIHGTLQSIKIIDAPKNGTVVWSPSLQVYVYLPNNGYCNNDTPDRFSYSICNNFGCDTANVFVDINCNPLIFYNGFSPNADGINDVFLIEGLEKYPNNELVIFNRWGVEVYQKKEYDNSWGGTFGNKTLPNGTYYYLFTDGEGHSYTGFVQVHQ